MSPQAKDWLLFGIPAIIVIALLLGWPLSGLLGLM
jgi:hypothetical protein